MQNSNYHVGVQVEKRGTDYTAGRKGIVMEIMDGRAKVLWTKSSSGTPMKLNTKVRFQDLILIGSAPSKEQLLILVSIKLTNKTTLLAKILKGEIDSHNHAMDEVITMIQDNITDNEPAMIKMIGAELVDQIKACND